MGELRMSLRRPKLVESFCARNSRYEIQAMIAAIEANGIEPVIDRSFELAAIADAFRLQESQQHFGKICLTI